MELQQVYEYSDEDGGGTPLFFRALLAADQPSDGGMYIEDDEWSNTTDSDQEDQDEQDDQDDPHNRNFDQRLVDDIDYMDTDTQVKTFSFFFFLLYLIVKRNFVFFLKLQEVDLTGVLEELIQEAMAATDTVQEEGQEVDDEEIYIIKDTTPQRNIILVDLTIECWM